MHDSVHTCSNMHWPAFGGLLRCVKLILLLLASTKPTLTESTCICILPLQEHLPQKPNAAPPQQLPKAVGAQLPQQVQRQLLETPGQPPPEMPREQASQQVQRQLPEQVQKPSKQVQEQLPRKVLVNKPVQPQRAVETKAMFRPQMTSGKRL